MDECNILKEGIISDEHPNAPQLDGLEEQLYYIIVVLRIRSWAGAAERLFCIQCITGFL